MKRKLSRHIFLGVLILVLLSCTFNLPSPGKTPSPMPVTGEQTTIPTGGPTANPTEAPAPQLSFVDLYQQNVQSGAWTEGGGLVKMLGYFNGEVPPGEVLGDRIRIEDEATGVFAMAQEYLADNPDAPEKAEIERLMNMLVPDPEKLLPYSEELKDFSMSVPKLAAAVSEPKEQEVACFDLWSDGFPLNTSGNLPTCFAWFNFTVGGTRFRVFIEQLWQSGGDTGQRTQLLNWTRDALTAAANEYGPLAFHTLLPTDVVFNQLAYRPNHTGLPDPTQGMVTENRRDHCIIGIFPTAFNWPDTVFQQELAHELFHCFQINNMVSAMAAHYPQRKWWYEGSAEYFSNIVYPDNNTEYNFIGWLDAHSPTTSLFHMNYDNFLFFQHMGNQYDKTYVLNVLFHLPGSGAEADYAAALDEFLPTNADDFYHSYGQGYLDGSIQDSGVTTAPVYPLPGDEMDMVSSNGYQTSASPWMLTWFRLKFPEKYKYTLTMTTSGDGRSSARRSGTTGNWGALPGVINTACGQREYTVLMTNTTPGSSYQFEVTVQNRVRKENCDRCVLGTWELIPESFDPYMRSIISQVARLNSATVGRYTVTFDGLTGLATHIWESAVVDETKVGLSTTNSQGTFVPDMQIVITMNGTTTSEFDAEEGATPHQGRITYGPAGGLLDVRTSINGVCLGNTQYNARDMNWTSAEQATYVCSADTLILTPVMAGLQVEPLRFRRITP
jgi:hypothetical protein